MVAFATVVAAGIGIAARGSSSSSSGGSSGATGGASGTVNGAGSTFAAPIYQQWSGSLKGQGVTLNYNAVGSGAGVTQLQAATVGFAGDDAPIKPTEVK